MDVKNFSSYYLTLISIYFQEIFIEILASREKRALPSLKINLAVIKILIKSKRRFYLEKLSPKEMVVMNTRHIRMLAFALVLLFVSQGCSFYARLGSLQQTPKTVKISQNMEQRADGDVTNNVFERR